MVFPVVMYACESWTTKKGECRRINAFECDTGEDSWESLGLQGDQTNSKGKWTLNIHWKTDAEAEAPILWLPYVKRQLVGKDPDAGKDWRQKEKGAAEEEMVK